MTTYAYECRLVADGQEDLVLPAASVTIRMRHNLASYMAWTIADPLPWAAAVAARSSGSMLLFVAQDGGEPAQILRVFVRSIYAHRTAERSVLTLAGDRRISYNAVDYEAQVQAVIRRVRSSDGAVTLDVGPDFRLTPMAVVDYGGPLPVRVGQVNATLTPLEGTMTLPGDPKEDLSRWMLDEGQDFYVEDCAGGRHGTVSTAGGWTTWVDTPPGGPAQAKCLSILAPEAYSQDVVGVYTSYNFRYPGFLAPLTLEAWVWPDSSVPDNVPRYILCHDANAELGGLYGLDGRILWEMIRRNHSGWSNRLYFYAASLYVPGSWENNEAWSVSADPLPEDQWSHVAVVLDPVANQVRQYINGQLQAAVSVHQDTIPDMEVSDAPLPFQIGCQAIYPRYRWHGLLADIRIWRAIRTGAQIAENMHAARCEL